MSTRPALTYAVLGPLRVVAGDQAVQVTAGKHRLLLVRLLLSANTVVSPDDLSESLWGWKPPATAPKLVQVYVSQLRKLLGEGALETHPTGYRLNVAPWALDSLVFVELVQDGRAARAAGNPGLARSRFSRALELWRGPALADAAYDEFARVEAERLEELRLATLEDRIEVDIASGASAEVVPELQALVASHPLRERLWGSLMLALYGAGRQADALDAYRDARRVLRDELGLEPGPRLRELERAILEQDTVLDVPSGPPAPGRRLPVAPTPLIGREDELRALQTLVESPATRLVTLAGAGGSGKSRLALELGHACQGSFANGVFLVELAPVLDEGHVPATVLDALGIAHQPGVAPLETLADWLAEREVLLIVDNVEHLVDAARELAALVSRAPGLTLVATSRRVLHLTGERVFPVPPLDDDDAVTLFVARAESAAPGSTDRATDGSVALEICHRLDNLPLAIELAAARTRALTLDALRDRLNNRLTFLVDGPRDLPARQRTLRETLAWSTGLLSESERRGLARLGVFAGGTTIAAARDVCGLDLSDLESLVSQSLVYRDATGAEPRFKLLETVREHAVSLLGDERHAVELEQARYFSELALEYLEFGRGAGWWDGAGQARWMGVLDAELDNLRAALARAETDDDVDIRLRLVGGLWRYWYVRGHLEEGLGTIRDALEADGGDPWLRAHLMFGGAGLAWALGDNDLAESLAEGLIELAAGDPFLVSGSATVLGAVAVHRKDYASARIHHERALAVAEAAGDEAQVNTASGNLGTVAYGEGNLREAIALWERTLVYCRRQDSDELLGITCLNIGLAAFRLGDLERARSSFEESRERFEAIAFREHLGYAELGLAAVTLAEGDPDAAAELLHASRASLEETGATPETFDAQLAEEVERDLRAALGEAEFEAILARSVA